MSRLTPIDAESNGQSHVYMELASVNMCNERYRAFLSDCIRRLAALEDILSPDDAPEIGIDELREMCKAKREGRYAILKRGESYWYCPNCKIEVDPHCVTNTEFHDNCGCPVIWVESPIIAAEDALAKEGEGT